MPKDSEARSTSADRNAQRKSKSDVDPAKALEILIRAAELSCSQESPQLALIPIGTDSTVS